MSVHLALDKKLYCQVGAAMALSLLHGGPAPRFFSPVFYQMLIGSVEQQITVDDILDTSVRQSVIKVIIISISLCLFYSDTYAFLAIIVQH